jgi:hypothetical protein
MVASDFHSSAQLQPAPSPKGISSRTSPGHGFCSPADVSTILSILADDLSSSMWHAGFHFLRLLLDPIPEKAVEYRERGAVTALGRRSWDLMIRMSARTYPWRATPDIIADAAADKRCGPSVAATLAATSHDNRLSPLHVSAYLCFCHGTYLYEWVRPFERAVCIHEEGFEHIFNYLFVVAGAAGISHAVQGDAACAVALLCVTAALSGFPQFVINGRMRLARNSLYCTVADCR